MRRSAIALLLLVSACDWEHYGLVNSVPLPPPQHEGRTVHLFLGLDGVSRAAFDDARAQGAFAGYASSTLISMYPATSDASWSRILHTRRFHGYEYTYYDETRDEIVRPGLAGLLQHVLPSFDPLAPPYVEAFDVHASDYFDAVGSYTTTRLEYAKALDQIFFVLAGRLDTQDVFFAYVLETDVLGHDESRDSVVWALLTLDQRLREFEARHADYRIQVTLFTDHGFDHVEKAPANVLHTAAEVASTGVHTVSSAADGRSGPQPWAVVIEHNRTTYVSVHTDPSLAEDVAQRISTNPKFDLVVSRGALWKDGAAVARFTFDATRDEYTIQGFGYDGVWTDDALFAATMGTPYPDLFFRARTALEPISVEHPAQVVASLKPEYVALGYAAPGFGTAGTAGSHGSLARVSSEGVLATQERDLPAYVRSDNVLSLFPALRAHVEARHGPLLPGDPNAGLTGQ